MAKMPTAKSELSDCLGQTAHIAAIARRVSDFVHNRLDQANAKPPFSFFMDKVVQVGLTKTVDIEHLTIIHDLKNHLTLLGYIYIKFEVMVGIAMMRVNHQVGYHFIQGQYNLIQYNIRSHMGAQRLPDEVAHALEILQAAADVILIMH